MIREKLIPALWLALAILIMAHAIAGSAVWG